MKNLSEFTLLLLSTAFLFSLTASAELVKGKVRSANGNVIEYAFDSESRSYGINFEGFLDIKFLETTKYRVSSATCDEMRKGFLRNPGLLNADSMSDWLQNDIHYQIRLLDPFKSEETSTLIMNDLASRGYNTDNLKLGANIDAIQVDLTIKWSNQALGQIGKSDLANDALSYLNRSKTLISANDGAIFLDLPKPNQYFACDIQNKDAVIHVDFQLKSSFQYKGNSPFSSSDVKAIWNNLNLKTEKMKSLANRAPVNFENREKINLIGSSALMLEALKINPSFDFYQNTGLFELFFGLYDWITVLPKKNFNDESAKEIENNLKPLLKIEMAPISKGIDL